MYTTVRVLRREGLVIIRKKWQDSCFASAAINAIPHQWERSLAVVASGRRTSSKQSWRKTRNKVVPPVEEIDPVLLAESDAVDEQSATGVEEYDVSEPPDEVVQGDDTTDDSSENLVLSWVPPAYRGIDLGTKKGGTNQGPEVLKAKAKRLGRLRFNRTRGKDARQVRSDNSDIVLRILPEEAFYAKREKEESIEGAIKDLLVATAAYRNHFHPDSGSLTVDDGSKVNTFNKEMENRVTFALRSIHPEELVEQKQVLDSDSDFRTICRCLQQICSTSCSLSSLWRYGDKDGIVYTEFAEVVLKELVRLNVDRSHLRTRVSSPFAEQEGSPVKSGSTKSNVSVTGWFSDLISGYVPSIVKAPKTSMKSKETEAETLVALDDATLLSIKRLLKNVLASVAFTTQPPEMFEKDTEIFFDAAKTKEDQVLFENVGRRMLSLLYSTSSLVEVDGETLQVPMEMLCRAGTITSARLCNEVFQQYFSRACQVPFPLVLEAYLEAIKREADHDILLDVVEEVMGLLVAQWNISLPTHRVERILQVSIVLNCMAEADMGKVKGMSESGDFMVKRALGSKLYTQFFQEVHSNNPKVDNQTIPIANALLHLYAGSGQKSLLKTAKKLLSYMMNEQEDTMLLAALYPTVGACNAVLSSLVQSSAPEDDSVSSQADMVNSKKLSKSDFDFAQNVLSFMFSRSGTACFPNQITYELMFSLLEAANPRDIGIVGEELLLTIETNNMLNGTVSFSLPIATYNSVLQYWLLTVKSKEEITSASGERVVPCRRAVHLLHKLEIRSRPWMLSKSAIKGANVKNLYDPRLRPTRATYSLVLQICANTFEDDLQEEAAQIAVEVYHSMVKAKMFSDESLDVLLEDCPNGLVSERILHLIGKKIEED